MARRFVRVDLSDGARDFRPVGVEPGVPVIDKSGAHAKILFRWLGGLVGDPEWETEDAVNFYARDDQGGRLEEVTVHTVSADDLSGALKDDLEALQQRIGRARAENRTERALLKTIRQSFNALTQDAGRADRDNYFFRYKDVQGRWRLIWCPGYQRNDQGPATPVICSNPECNLLFVRRPGQNPKCPGCQIVPIRPVQPRAARRFPWAAALLLLLLLLLGGWWLWGLNRLYPTPENWAGPVGSRVDFQLQRRGLFGREDVTADARAFADDPRILQFDRGGLSARASGVGTTRVHFLYGDRASTTTTVTVQPATNPKTLRIEPGSVELGLHTTAHLKLVGEYENGQTCDLTAQGQWDAKTDKTITTHDGFVEGLAVGTSKVTARYRATPDDPWMEAAADVKVEAVDFKALEAAVEPDKVALGGGSKLRIDAVSVADRRYSVLESSRLRLGIDPRTRATSFGTYLRGDRLGHGTLSAAFDGKHAAKAEFDVVPPPGIDHLVVVPDKLEMVVNEIADLNVLSPSSDPITLASSDPAVVEIKANRLIGRREGTATVTVSQGAEKCTTEVTVTPGAIQSLALEPDRATLAPAQSKPLRAIGTLESKRTFEIVPDALKIEQLPADKYVTFHADDLSVRGVQATPRPETLAVSCGGKKGEAQIEVGGPVPVAQEEKPVKLRIAAKGSPPARFPVGADFDGFRVEATFPSGFTRVVTKKATLRTPEAPAEAVVSFADGQMHGVKPGKTTVSAEFDGLVADSPLPVEVTGAPDIDEIRVVPDVPVRMLPGESLTLKAVGYKNGQAAGNLDGLPGLAWKSDAPQTVRVDGSTATALEAGKANCTAQLGSITSAPARIAVVKSIPAGLDVDRVVRIWKGQSARLGREFYVEREGRDVSEFCDVQSANPRIARYSPETKSVVGVAPGATEVSFSYGGKTTSALVQVLDGELPAGHVLIEPGTVQLSAGQAFQPRVYLVPESGPRIDRTDAAVLKSSAAEKAAVVGSLVGAVSPGEAEITATLPEAAEPGRAVVRVDDLPLTELSALPPRLDLQVGDTGGVQILGKSASGTHPLFPQERLKLAAAGAKPGAIKIGQIPVGDRAIDNPGAIAGADTGEAEVQATWDGKLRAAVPVSVRNDPWSDLLLEPTAARLRPGDRTVYMLSAIRGGKRRVLWPEEGMKLSVANPEMAEVVDQTWIQAKKTGPPTTVIGEFHGLKASAPLEVVDGESIEELYRDGTVVPPDIIVSRDGTTYHADREHRRVVRVSDGGGGDVIDFDPFPVPAVRPRSGVLAIEPDKVAVRKGQKTPALRVVVQEADGTSRTVEAAIESVNPEILAPGDEPNTFLGKEVGQTQVRATVDGQTVSADVSVTGERFNEVDTRVAEQTDTDFVLACEIKAAAGEGDLEYRVYQIGQEPPPQWVQAEKSEDRQSVRLQSPRIRTGPPSQYYDLVFEARNRGDNTIQKYPYRFRLHAVPIRTETK